MNQTRVGQNVATTPRCVLCLLADLWINRFGSYLGIVYEAFAMFASRARESRRAEANIPRINLNPGLSPDGPRLATSALQDCIDTCLHTDSARSSHDNPAESLLASRTPRLALSLLPKHGDRSWV